MYFVVKKVRVKLQSWDARQLSIAGRATLAQLVLLSILGHFMQSMMILKKISDEIEWLAWTFIWSTTDGRNKMSLVGWDSVCQPKDRSGLGMRQLHDQNISFLLKLGYNMVFDEKSLWVQVIISKYGLDDSLPDSIKRGQSSFIWKSLSKV
ncbi:hypothetical protein PVK06_017448 [Gossypium arboreum]|uniref:Uncharacterized protein n=1 Tax=Gossypium arboreum TaxID=29729 RepID=A0ABR0Q3M7_GOSAR|nr:hypothetical protein PVK06_017448 [Gossypium arboreum]